MKLLFLLLLACVTLHISSATTEAQGPDGVRFLRACGATVKQQDGINVSDQEMIESLWCIGYVEGFGDAISTMQSVTKSRGAVCLPPQGIANDQAIRIFVKYLRDNPQTLHESGRSSLYIALAKAFPCR